MAMGVQTVQPDARIEWNETLDQIRTYVASRVGDRQLAEDITQDVIVRSIAAGALDKVDNPVAWLIRSASNAIVDHFRTHRRTDSIDDDIHHALDDVDENETLRSLAQCVRPMIARLDPPYRDALMSVDIDGATQLEAAKLANVSLSGMKSRVQRGRRQLRTMLTSCCEIELDARDQPIESRPRSTAPCGCAGAGGCSPDRSSEPRAEPAVAGIGAADPAPA
jgi:RNA polymerase sigma-70 factor (ECF subfamily)